MKTYNDFNWLEIQEYYNLGYSLRDVIKKFNISSNSIIYTAKNKGLFITRNGKNSETEIIRNKRIVATKLFFSKQSNRNRHSEIMRNVVINNPESYNSNNVCGRVKNIEFMNKKLKGSWELLVAKLFEENKIKWNTVSIPFNYFWNNRYHLYFPDFYLEEYDMYIEVKGYKRDRDICKWKAVKNLKIIQYDEILKIKENSFSIYEFLK